MTTASMSKNGADYVASDSDRLPGTPIARWDANIAAIKTLKGLEAQGRPATPAEQAVLAKYSGFGDSAFEPGFSYYTREPAWLERKEALEELTTEAEYGAIRKSRLNAFYTSPAVVKTMWQEFRDLGADKIPNPKVLEPSAGSGRFLGYQPPEMAARSSRTAVELDNLTAGMVKHLYPNTTVWNTGFQDAPIPDDSFDLAISNVPFGNYGVHDKEYLGSGRKFLTGSIQNYFFAKTLDKLRPGGVMAFITTHHTLDAPKAKRVREYLAEQADLVGAVRLPDDAFPDTQVVTDIIYLRKRGPGEEPGDTSWVETEDVFADDYQGRLTTTPVNKYFADNRDMVLGSHSTAGSMYAGSSYTVKSKPGSEPLQQALASATRKIASTPIHFSPPAPQPLKESPILKAAPSSSDALSARDQARRQGMLEIGSTARKLLDLEKDSGDEDESIEQARAALREQYETFVANHSALNAPANRRLMSQEPDAPLLLALENHDKDTGSWEPAAVFSRRVVGSSPQREAANASDALSVVVNETGSLDFDRMGQLLGQSPDSVREALASEGLIFRNPLGKWEPAKEYLTGPVREKLQTARRMAAQDPSYQGNGAYIISILGPRPTAASLPGWSSRPKANTGSPSVLRTSLICPSCPNCSRM